MRIHLPGAGHLFVVAARIISVIVATLLSWWYVRELLLLDLPWGADPWRFAAGTAAAVVCALAVGAWLGNVVARIRGSAPHPRPILAFSVATLLLLALPVGSDGFLSSSGYNSIWAALAPLAMVPLHVLVHELAHALAGACLGYRTDGIRLGSLLIRRRDGRLQVDRAGASIPGQLGFHVGTLTIDEGRALRLRIAAHAAAGPIANLALAWLFVRWAHRVSPPVTDLQLFLSPVLWMGAFSGFFLAGVNALPFRSRHGVRTDGGIVRLALWAGRGERLLLKVGHLMGQGNRPSAWRVHAQELADAASSTPAEAPTLLLFAGGVAADLGDAATAQRHWEAALGSKPHRFVKGELLLQLSMLAALDARDPDSARRRLAECGELVWLLEYPLLASASIDLVEGRAGSARANVARWREAVERTGLGTSILVGNEWALDRISAELLASAGSG